MQATGALKGCVTLSAKHARGPAACCSQHAALPLPPTHVPGRTPHLVRSITANDGAACRCVGSLQLAIAQCKRGQARDKELPPLDGDDAAPGALPANAPAAVVGMQAAQLGEQLLECVHVREQKLWALQLDARDLRQRLEDRRGAAEAAQSHSLVVRCWACDGQFSAA